ncbi:MAG: FAD-dependent oxidoreductase, partial [Pseudomonadota bacterium]
MTAIDPTDSAPRAEGGTPTVDAGGEGTVVRRAARLPRDVGVCGWNALLPPPLAPRVLEDDTTADWLVIGAGWAGLAAARRLSQLVGHDRIVVLEAGRLGEGPAGRNSGFMIDLPHKLQS